MLPHRDLFFLDHQYETGTRNLMALPTLSSRWRPSGVEKRRQSVHEQENNHRHAWNEVVKYNSNNALRTSWAARQNPNPSHDKSLDDRSSKDRKKENLHKRRMKLGQLLKEEGDKLESELRSLKIGQSSRLEEMRERADGLKSARKEKDQKIAQEKLYEHWQRNNPELRALDSELLREHVKETWGLQKYQKSERIEEEKAHEKQYANEYEEARMIAMEALRNKEKEKRKAEIERGKILKQQMRELEERAKESELLKKEEGKILSDQIRLEKMEAERQNMKKQAEQKKLGSFLHRQFRAQMRSRAREIQEELELDRQILVRLIEEERREQDLKSARQDSAKRDVAWMKQIMEEQIKLEKEREAELDLMYREEARQAWEKREEVWKKEREARERLLQDVLGERSSQLASKMRENKQKQKELLKERNALIFELEEARQISEREKKIQEELKLRQRDELQEQVTSRREKTARQKDDELDDLKEEKEAEREYREFMQAETQRRKLIGHQPRQHGRRRTAWD